MEYNGYTKKSGFNFKNRRTVDKRQLQLLAATVIASSIIIWLLTLVISFWVLLIIAGLIYGLITDPRATIVLFLSFVGTMYWTSTL